jgi:formylglycine-generating enzyme required for sulfatase activity
VRSGWIRIMSNRARERQPSEPEMIHVPAGPFLMGTSDRQVDWLAQISDRAKKWRARGYFDRDNDVGFRCARS